MFSSLVVRNMNMRNNNSVMNRRNNRNFCRVQIS